MALSYDALVIERSVSGQAWRFFSVYPDFAGIKLGRPANIIGDGVRTAQALIGAKNAELLDPIYAQRMLAGFKALFGIREAAAGVIIADPTAPPGDGNLHVLELNAAPALLAYHYRREGPMQDICEAIIAMLQRERR